MLRVADVVPSIQHAPVLDSADRVVQVVNVVSRGVSQELGDI
jgi:hypothetical protein